MESDIDNNLWGFVSTFFVCLFLCFAFWCNLSFLMQPIVIFMAVSICPVSDK